MKAFDINDYSINQDLFINASAGTGKTFTIELLAAKLVEEGIPLSKILIVTYTEKATGELRDRIRQKMESSLADKLKKNEDVSAFRRAMQDIHSAPIFTIHSFCQNTLRSFAYEANVPMNLDVVADDGVEALVEKHIRDDWAQDEDFKNFILSSGEKDQKKFKDEFKNAVKKINLADNVILHNGNFKNFQELYALYPQFKKNWDFLKARENEKGTNGKVISELLNVISAWNGEGKLFPGKKFQKPKWINKANKDEIIIWDDEKINESIKYFFTVQAKNLLVEAEPQQKFIFRCVNDIRNEWEAYKKDSKLQSYDNMIQTVRKAVMQENSELTKRLRETYRIAIIDEFQDTNQKQWDIFSTVFQKSDGQCNLIVVGDPKQSIYSFQGADLNVFEEAIKTFNEENGKVLPENNRSSDCLIEACNTIFKKDFFSQQDFEESSFPPVNRKKLPATLNDKAIPPLWIADGKPKVNDKENVGVSERVFAKFAVTKILECCKIRENGHTALQVYDKDEKKLVDVRFSDFAILARSRGEMTEIESQMSLAGIPFTRYKDKNLFKGREPFQWISILEAIDVPDFAGHRITLYNQALFSDFFRISLDDMATRDYSDPQQEPMSLFIQWRKLARKKKWAELQERIYQDTHIDEYLSKPNSLQSVAKIRQIGSYIFDYLYNNHASLEEAIKHLKEISSYTESTDNDDAIVAKDGDFDAVQVMTIHASKGLAFPVTIVVGGHTGHYNQATGPFVYSNEGAKVIGFDSNSKKASVEEQNVEWQRLIYVAYTRAQSLMILPRYERQNSTPFAFMDARIDEIKKNAELARTEKFSEDDWNLKDVRAQAKAILEEFTKKDEEDLSVEELQKGTIQSLQKSLGSLSIFQYSYSSLSNRKKAKDAKNKQKQDPEYSYDSSITNADDSRTDREESSSESMEKEVSIVVDNPDNILRPCQNYEKTTILRKLANYPRGAKLGNAIHESLEHVDFVRYGGIQTEDDAVKDLETQAIIEERFIGQSFSINSHNDWKDLTAKYIWHTLNAKLPEIHGSRATGKEFSLNQLDAKDRKAEMEFRLNAQFSNWLNRFCKGFIDLLFVRYDEKTGQDYYSILDWKSDVLEDDGYSDSKAVAEKVDEEYSIQRVLYSYCLIKWLAQFKHKEEKDIFEEHFGGIYYAFVRGCEAGTCNGIYAQTWKDYDALVESFKHVVGLMGG